MELEKYSIGVGDRFGRQGKAQLLALMKAREQGIETVPVWNKSHREHTTIKSSPADVRAEADEAVKALGWTFSYFVDADHIGLSNVDLFLDSSDFFTLDVADFIGREAPEDAVRAFVDKHGKYTGSLQIPGIERNLHITEEQAGAIARKFLLAVREAGGVYRHIESAKGRGNFITEVSMDETDEPQTPVEMLFILAALADEGIPAQTIAPKFTGRFNKGVDYVGDVGSFTKEFEEDLAVIAFGVREFGLPADLKLSIHSGSDKFSLYGPVNEALGRSGAGLHLKTAGTTWLEELTGLATGGGEGLEIARDVYCTAVGRFDELCAPYATVIDIQRNNLPSPEVVRQWGGAEYANALRHNRSCKEYNPCFRQILHVAYKVATEMGERYLKALETFEEVISKNVIENIWERHVQSIFPPAHVSSSDFGRQNIGRSE